MLELPAAASLPPGWSCRLRLASPAPNHLQIRTAIDGDALNHLWRTKHIDGSPMRYGLFMGAARQAGTLTCDGTSQYALDLETSDAMSSVRIVTHDSNVTPQHANEIVHCDATRNPIHLVIDALREWCPESPIPRDCPAMWHLEVVKIDPTPHKVVMWTAEGTRIEPNNDSGINPGYDRGYLYLTRQHDTAQLRIAADGVFVRGFFRASHLPQS